MLKVSGAAKAATEKALGLLQKQLADLPATAKASERADLENTLKAGHLLEGGTMVLADADGILRSACAFANTSGGTIFVGVEDGGAVVGVSLGRNTGEQLARRLTENVFPPLFVHLEEEELGDHDVRDVIVDRGP